MNSSLLGRDGCPLCRKDSASLRKRGGAVLFEMATFQKAEVLVEDGGVNSNEFQKASHLPEALHGALSSPERKVRIVT
uniref:hypothetical protein n=1 Tax=Sedimentitalea xiamensis TaxID=3050037 RepID=UPI00253FD83A|nr:hypothetical protein [Sedimentitalea xiamensis]